MTDLKKYADSMVVLPRKMTSPMMIAWFTAERDGATISGCWDAAVEAFEQEKKRPSMS